MAIITATVGLNYSPRLYKRPPERARPPIQVSPHSFAST